MAPVLTQKFNFCVSVVDVPENHIASGFNRQLMADVIRVPVREMNGEAPESNAVIKKLAEPSAYLTLWRMCLARDFMQGQGLTVSQSAHRVGYESEVAFSRAFRWHFGISPGKMRAKSA